MKKFEISSSFMGYLFTEIEANNKEEAKIKFLQNINALLTQKGTVATLENVELNNNTKLSELNILFGKPTKEDISNWENLIVEEIE